MEKCQCLHQPLLEIKCHRQSWVEISDMLHRVSPLRSAESDLTRTTGMQDHGGSVREDAAQSNGEPTLPPFDIGDVSLFAAGNGGQSHFDMVPSQLVPDVFDHFSVQDVASSSPSHLHVPQRGATSSTNAFLSGPKTFSLKRTRQRGESPHSKFAFATPKKKEKQD